MNLAILEQFGLNVNDIKVYGALCSVGRSKTGRIISASKVTSSRVYESLRILIEKGLVSYEVKNNIKYYKAEVPEQLIEQSEKDTVALKNLAHDIQSLSFSIPDRNDTNTYEGIHAFKQAFLRHSQNIEKGERVSVIAFSNHTVTKNRFTQLRNLFTQIDDVLFAKTRNVHMLLDKRLHPLLKKERKQFEKYIVKFLPPGYFSPVAVNISKREVLLSVWGDKPTVFSMKNPTIVQSFQKNFDFLWNLAKED
jgi:sugar-specific transcriptional regulator TrmB